MMIRTAGGPGLVSPIDFNERRGPRLSRSAWIAIGVVAAAHVGVGVALYYQRFEMPEPIAVPTSEGYILTLQPRPEPKPVETERKPLAPNTPIHETSAPAENVETVAVVINENVKPTDGHVISLSETVPESVDNGSPATEPPAPPAARVIRNPSWSRQPSADQMMQAYPNRALENGLAGSAALNCLVQDNGSVAVCDVVSETPAGQGFGRAAQRLSRYFRINPRTVDGAAEGSRVTINLRFVPPAE